MDVPLRNLGRRIQELRKSRGWSQERFADICGVHRTYMGHLERGEKNVSFHTLLKLAEALGISVSELVADERAGVPTRMKRGAKTPKAIQGDDLDGIVRELNNRRITLEETAGVLKKVADALRKRKP